MSRFQASISVSTRIPAPADAVWRAVADLDRYRDWNPFYVFAAGDVVEGGTVILDTELAGRRPTRSRARVISVEHGRSLRWRSRYLLPGLLDSDHSFDLITSAPDGTELRQRETLTGVLVPITANVREQVRQGCIAMNDAVVSLLGSTHHGGPDDETSTGSDPST